MYCDWPKLSARAAPLSTSSRVSNHSLLRHVIILGEQTETAILESNSSINLDCVDMPKGRTLFRAVPRHFLSCPLCSNL